MFGLDKDTGNLIIIISVFLIPKYLLLVHNTHCRKTREMAEKMFGRYDMYFWHLEGILNLSWYIKIK